MTTEEKAKGLVKKYADELNLAIDNTRLLYNNAKHCAIICCDEIIGSYQQTLKDKDLYGHQPSIELASKDSIRYWQQVKEEIQKL